MEETNDVKDAQADIPSVPSSSSSSEPANLPFVDGFESVNQHRTLEDPALSLTQAVADDALLGSEIANEIGIANENIQTAPIEVEGSKPPNLSDSLKPEVVPSDSSEQGTNNVASQSENGSSITVTDAHNTEESNAHSEKESSENRSLSVLSEEPRHCQGEVVSSPTKVPAPAISSQPLKIVKTKRGLIDTAAPFESVKDAVTKFGGIVDWKAHKTQTMEMRKHVQAELEKAKEEIPEYKKRSEAAEVAKDQVLKELDSTRRLLEELKLSLEKARTEEAQAKQDSELVQLRVKELEQGIDNEGSVAAKAQLDVAKARHAAAIAELKSVKDEVEEMQKEYVSLVSERDVAIKRAEEAISTSKDIEKIVEDLTLELITSKETLESAHVAQMEAEEHKAAAALARDQDSLNWQKELKRANDELQQLTEKLLPVKDLQSNLGMASTLLQKLKGELAAYMQEKLNQEFQTIAEDNLKGDENEEAKKTHAAMHAEVASTRKELEVVNIEIEKAKEEVKCLSHAALALKTKLESEEATLAAMRQQEEMASAAISSLKAELNRTNMELELAQAKEKEATDQMVELPKALQKAACEADQARSEAQLAREELRKAQEEAEQAKSSASTMESRLNAALKEIEAAKASERLALEAIKALEESKQAASNGVDDSQSGVTLPLEEYYTLSKRVHDAEEQANERVTAARAQIEAAKDSELKCIQKLEEASRELAERKEALKLATEKTDKAQEGKLGIEQELRDWRAEHEQCRKANEAAVNPSRSPQVSFEEINELKRSSAQQDAEAFLLHTTPTTNVHISENNTENVHPEQKVKKKKSFFPRIVMFLARKKSHMARQ